MTYYYYDSVVYRLPRPGAHFERWLNGKWVPARGDVAPSQEEYNRMRQITEAEAQRRMGA